MFIPKKEYEQYLNYIGLIYDIISKHNIPLLPSDINFNFCVDKSNISVKVENVSKEPKKFTAKNKFHIKEIEAVLSNYVPRNEFTKTSMLKKRIGIINNFQPNTEKKEITGEFINEKGEKVAIDLSSVTKKSLIIAINSELILYESTLNTIYNSYIENFFNGNEKSTNEDIELMVIIQLQIDRNATEDKMKLLQLKAVDIYSKLKQTIFKDEKFTKNISFYFCSCLDPSNDKNLFSRSNKGVGLFEYDPDKKNYKNEIFEISKDRVHLIFKEMKKKYDLETKQKILENLKILRSISKKIKKLNYLPEYRLEYNLSLEINEEWSDFELKELTYLSVRGDLRTKEYNIVKAAYDNLEIGSSFLVNEMKTISFKPTKTCFFCGIEIKKEDYQYFCYWCNISFCTSCVEKKIASATTNKDKYLHPDHNLMYFKTKDENNMKDIDEYKLGSNLCKDTPEERLSPHHSAICNGCREGFSQRNKNCQRYICLTCRPGVYRGDGYVDFDYSCIMDYREKKGKYRHIVDQNEDHDDEKHIYLMLICQAHSYQNY